MKKIMMLISAMMITGSAHATTMGESPAMRLGIDSSVPYLYRANGTNVKTRGNINMGVDYRYFTSENMNLGLRASFDVEKRSGTNRQFGVSPGMQYLWTPGETWVPFARADLPFTLRGAPNTSGSSSKQDVGVSGGLGMGWNVGKQFNSETNLMLRYDLDVAYMFGVGSAVNSLSFEFAKIGLDYRF